MTGLSEEGEPRTGLRVSDFDFELPTELIAQQPPAERGQSRMLVMNRATGAVRDSAFAEFPSLLNPGDLLVLNDTRVIPARLYAAAQQCATSRMAHKLSVPHPCAFFLAQGWETTTLNRRLFNSRVPQVRGPHGQVFVRGVEVRIFGPGKAHIQPGASK